MNFSSIAKYGGLIVAGAALVSFLFSLDYLFSSKRELLTHAGFCAGILAAGLITSAFGEIAAQLKRRADAAEESNRIAERRANLDGARLAQDSNPRHLQA